MSHLVARFIVILFRHFGLCVRERFHVSEVVNEAVSEADNRQKKVLLAVKENPSITIRQLTEKTGIAKATLEREIRKMKQNGLIKRIGSDKTGHWEVIK